MSRGINFSTYSVSFLLISF